MWNNLTASEKTFFESLQADLANRQGDSGIRTNTSDHISSPIAILSQQMQEMTITLKGLSERIQRLEVSRDEAVRHAISDLANQTTPIVLDTPRLLNEPVENAGSNSEVVSSPAILGQTFATHLPGAASSTTHDPNPNRGHDLRPDSDRMTSSNVHNRPSTTSPVPDPQCKALSQSEKTGGTTSNVLAKPTTTLPSTATTVGSNNPLDAPVPFIPVPTLFREPTRIRLAPKEYDGKEPWVVYRRHFETVARANGWSNDLKALYIAPYLRGTALNFYDTLSIATQQDFEQLDKVLSERFSDGYLQSVSHSQLRGRIQRGQESLAEFATVVQRLVNLSPGDCPDQARNRIALAQFLDGIADLEIQQRVRDSEPDTLELALARAIKIEASRDASRLSRRHIRAAEATVTAPTPRPRFSQNTTLSGKGRRLL